MRALTHFDLQLIESEQTLLGLSRTMYEKTPRRVFSYMSPWFDFFTASWERRFSMHSSLNCSACGANHDTARLQNVCRACGKPLFASYQLGAIRDAFRPALVRARPL